MLIIRKLSYFYLLFMLLVETIAYQIFDFFDRELVSVLKIHSFTRHTH